MVFPWMRLRECQKGGPLTECVFLSLFNELRDFKRQRGSGEGGGSH